MDLIISLFCQRTVSGRSPFSLANFAEIAWLCRLKSFNGSGYRLYTPARPKPCDGGVLASIPNAFTSTKVSVNKVHFRQSTSLSLVGFCFGEIGFVLRSPDFISQFRGLPSEALRAKEGKVNQKFVYPSQTPYFRAIIIPDPK